MRSVQDRRIAASWLILVTVVVTAAALLWWLLMYNAPPHNAVLIERAASEIRAATPNPTSRAATPQMLAATEAPSATAATLAVYVSGAVVTPGVYYLPQGSRVTDALEAAGGLLPTADAGSINLAARLVDEEHVAVPERAAQVEGTSVSEPPPLRTPTRFKPSATPVSKPTSKSIAGTEQNAGVILNINTATAIELEELPGIGPALAQRIVQSRLEHGPFATVEDLKRVPGIGSATVDRLRPLVTVGRP